LENLKFRAKADWDDLKLLPIRPHEDKDKVHPISSLYKCYKWREGSIETAIVDGSRWEVVGRKRRAATQETTYVRQADKQNKTLNKDVRWEKWNDA
jgi:hypothetical protein